jgi:hypothetical protein
MAEAPKNRKRFWWRVVIFSAIAVGALAMVVPNFVACRPSPLTFRSACINNLLQINGAKEQWAADEKAEPGTAVVEAEIAQYIKGGALPQCPRGGKYTIGKVGELPRCSIPDHVIPPR